MDENSASYQQHLEKSFRHIVSTATERKQIPTVETLEAWHRRLYQPVETKQLPAGKMRQVTYKLPVLAQGVQVGDAPGVPSAQVPKAMKDFCMNLSMKVNEVDAIYDSSDSDDAHQLESVISLIAWAHGEMCRIHPFRDGNGRMSRLLSNLLLARYAIPYELKWRPRPTGNYPVAAAASMKNNHSLMEAYLKQEIVTAMINRETI